MNDIDALGIVENMVSLLLALDDWTRIIWKFGEMSICAEHILIFNLVKEGKVKARRRQCTCSVSRKVLKHPEIECTHK